MAKRIFITLLFASLVVAPLLCQEGQNPRPKGETYLITEIYHKLADTALNLKEEFVDRNTFLAILPETDSTWLIIIGHGGEDGVEFGGEAEKIENPGFNATRDDAEFYLWKYISPDSPTHERGALVFKEYVTGSLEQRGSKYFFFSIMFSPESEFQIYGKLREK